MAWRRVLLMALAATAMLATETRADNNACPPGQFPVSVLDDPVVRCLASRPCSGVYGPQGLLTGVGACPSGTGCALLPHNPSVMGCVVAGRADVSYVNPDGSLTLGGKVISGPPVNNNNGNNNGNSNNNGTIPTAAPTSTPAPSATSNLPTTPGSVKPAGDDTKAPSSTPSTAKPSTTEAATSTPPAETTPAPTTGAVAGSTPAANQQSALGDINGEIANSKRGTDSANGLGLSSIIAIVVGCLAVVAVIAGVFVLRKKKEQTLGTPEGGALDEYGGGVTPKENVLLL